MHKVFPLFFVAVFYGLIAHQSHSIADPDYSDEKLRRTARAHISTPETHQTSIFEAFKETIAGRKKNTPPKAQGSTPLSQEAVIPAADIPCEGVNNVTVNSKGNSAGELTDAAAILQNTIQYMTDRALRREASSAAIRESEAKIANTVSDISTLLPNGSHTLSFAPCVDCDDSERYVRTLQAQNGARVIAFAAASIESVVTARQNWITAETQLTQSLFGAQENPCTKRRLAELGMRHKLVSSTLSSRVLGLNAMISCFNHMYSSGKKVDAGL